VRGDGSIGAGKVLVDATAEFKAKKPGLPDGLKVDTKGNLWATGPGGVWIIAPDGTHLGTIWTGVPTANVAWGDDGGTLYITANTAVWRVKTKTVGKMP
jgi:gluconolactonase